MSDSLLTNLGNAIKTALVTSQKERDAVATGRTIRDTEVITEGNTRVYIVGPAHLLALERGRKPTSATGPYQQYGYNGLSFKDNLRLWMEARKIDEGKIPPGGYGPILWAIYTKINQKGYEARRGIITDPLSDDNLNKLMDEHLGPLAGIYATEVLNELFDKERW